MKIKNILLPILLSILLVEPLQAIQVEWLGGIGFWNEDDNWSTGKVPEPEDGVLVNSGTVIIDAFAEIQYIHLNGGNLEVSVSGMLYMTPETVWQSPPNGIRGIVIEVGSQFDNYGSTFLIEPSGVNSSPILVFCDGNFTNHSNALFYCQGDHSTGLHAYVNGSGIINNGEILMPFIENGMNLLSAFTNNGILDIGSTGYAILNRSQFDSASSSEIFINGRIICNTGSSWIHRGYMDIDYSSTQSASVFQIDGTVDIQTNGTISIEGTHAPLTVNSAGILRVRGDLNIFNSKAYTSALSNSGLIVNHQNGSVNTEAHYGVYNRSNGEIRNFGNWYANLTTSLNFSTLWNIGVFSNRPKGKLFVEGRLNLKPNSWFNNQGHMFVLDDYVHEDLSGQFNNTGTLNDVYNNMSSINNNTSVRVHQITDELEEGVPIFDILDIGNNPGATVLGWYTSSGGNSIAGSYDATTNTFTPNVNGAGLSSVWVRTRINAGGITRRHELKVGTGSPRIPLDAEINFDADFDFEIAPNPVRQKFRLNIKHTFLSEDLKYDIYNTMGQLENTGRFSLSANFIEIPANLPSGIYFLSVYDPLTKIGKTRKIRIVR